MAVTKKEIAIILQVHDQMTRKLRGASRASKGLGRSLGKLAGIAAGFVGFRAIAAQTVGAIRESVMFQKQLAEISTMLDENIGPTMARFKTEIMALAAEFGQSKEVLTKGLYDILSAGIAAGDGITVLRVAAKAAIGGVTDAAVAVDALTTVMNAYGLSADQATKVSDLMFSTVKEGKITYAELAENIGKIAPVAKAANVPLEDMFAMLATAVKVEKPERAFTAIRAALMTAAAGGRNFLDVLREMRGATLQQILVGKKQEDQIMATGKAAKEAGQDAVVFAKRAAVGVSILTGNWEELEEQLIKAKNSGGKADIAFQKMADTNFQKMAKLNQSWKNLKVSIGDAVAESKYFAEWMAEITALFQGYGLGRRKAEREISEDARTEHARRLKDYKEHLVRMRETPGEVRARELTARMRAIPGIEEAPSPLAGMPGIGRAGFLEPRERLRRARARLTRARGAFEGIDIKGTGPTERKTLEQVNREILSETQTQNDKFDQLLLEMGRSQITGRSFK